VPAAFVQTLLDEFTEYHVVESQPSGSTSPYTTRLYYLNSDGQQFLDRVQSLIGSPPSTAHR
jgi:hypothetical protein